MWGTILFTLFVALSATCYIFRQKIKGWLFLLNIVRSIIQSKDMYEAFEQQKSIDITPVLQMRENKCLELTYWHGSKEYKIIFPKKRGPCNIVSVKSDRKDITQEFKKIIGPAYNFHGIPTTPKMLGLDKDLEIEFIKGRNEVYNADELIKF